MSFKVFYSWQSEIEPGKYTRTFIENCLKEAIKRIKVEYRDDSPEIILDRATDGEPGSPNIPLTIDKKIRSCDVFVGDLTFVGLDTRGRSNSNVLIELGIAMSTLEDAAVLNVMNVHYGEPTTANMPFDISQKKFPITYLYSQADDKETTELVKKQLIRALFKRIKEVLDTRQERQKEQMRPFLTWYSWNETYHQKLEYESFEYLETISQTISAALASASTGIRIFGLSGLGKTNLVQQYFRPKPGIMEPTQTAKVLYADMNRNDQTQVLAKIDSLFLSKEDRTIVLDNCPAALHSKVMDTLQNPGPTLRLISISPEPDESVQLFDSQGRTTPIKLIAREFKPVVMKLLEKNFPELSQEDQMLFVEYSNGLPFFAVLMAENTEAARIRPGTLTPQNILDKLLGSLYTEFEHRKIVMACALFSRFGYFDPLNHQKDAIALSHDLCMITETDPELRKRRFKQVTDIMKQRQLLEQVGFSMTFRPTPLALKLAEEWWDDCTAARFERIIPVLKDNKLVEQFCQQFRLLTHIEHAREVVGKLCQGVFSTAEVLNTEVGSRLFRSFVHVNPAACLKALQTAFAEFSTAELMQIVQGRRNLIWALEQLCFKEATFDGSIRILANFAVAENEHITNNALGQFLQLFHIKLPGTMVNLERRWGIIEYLLEKGGDFYTLGIRAARRALKSDNFTRMINADEPSTSQPNDYDPTYREIGDYWNNALNLLIQQIEGDTPYKAGAIESITNAIKSFAEQGLGMLIIPQVEKLFDQGFFDWKELRETLQFVLDGQQSIHDEVVIKLEELLEKITPADFKARFQIYVKEPSRSDYFRNRKSDRDFLELEGEKLANEFAENKDTWADLVPSFVSGQISEGIKFGNHLGSLITNGEQEDEVLNLIIESLKQTSERQQNLVVLIGFLNANGNVKQSKTIRTYRRINQDSELFRLSFTLAQRIELPYSDLEELIEQTKKGRFESSYFLAFKYGWGLKHLEYEQVTTYIDSLCKLDDKGKAAAFTIAYSWSYNNDESWAEFRHILKFLIQNYGFLIMGYLQDEDGGYALSETIHRLLHATQDQGFALFVSHLVVELLNKEQGHYLLESQLYRICDVLIAEYFDIFWEVFKTIYTNPEVFSNAIDHAEQLMGSTYDYSRKGPGLLFGNSKRKGLKILEFVKSQPYKTAVKFARIIPLHDSEHENLWHPIAQEFLNAFGDNVRFLEEISAKMGSYSWINSVVPKLEVEKAMFNSLSNHSNPKVKAWALQNIDYLTTRIEWETNSDAEGHLRLYR